MGNRNEHIDVLKGIGIILMLLGHCSLNYYVRNFIFVFHMPLFFCISGFLYHEKNWEQIKKLANKLLLPYFVTIAIITPIQVYWHGLPWFASALFIKETPTILGQDFPGQVGPLWYLVVYFISFLIFNSIIINTKSKIVQFSIFFAFFELSLMFTKIFDTTLPFGLLQCSGACLFLWFGYIFKNKDKIHPIFPIIGLISFVACSYWGVLSMASFIYKLNFLQIIGGLFGTYILYEIICTNNIRSKYLAKIGTFTLPILCFHSIDFTMQFSKRISNYIWDNQILQVSTEMFSEIIFVCVCIIICSRIGILKKVYNI